MSFLDFANLPANCVAADGSRRSLATRLWLTAKTPGPDVLEAAARAQAELSGPAGRVLSAGTFTEPRVRSAIAGMLPPGSTEFLRPQMEWYGCRGAFFHNDAHYGGVLFGVWTVAGPPRSLVFPRVGVSVAAAVGSLVVFDPFEPHAVLDAGRTIYRKEDYESAEANLFAGFEIELVAAVRAEFGIVTAHEGVMALSSRVAINPETGAFARSAA
jgi:hypothetical protein